MRGSLVRRLGLAREAVERQRRALRRASPQSRVNVQRQQVDDLARRAARTAAHTLALRRSGVEGLQARLAALSPLSTLERGYAVVRHADTGALVCSVAQVDGGDPLAVRVRDGEFGAVVRAGAGNSRPQAS